MGSSLPSPPPMHALPRQPPHWKNACLSLCQAPIALLQGGFLPPGPFLLPQTPSDVCIMNWKLRVSAMFCVITTSPKTRDQKQETFISFCDSVLWLLRAPGQGGFGYSTFCWHLGRADVLRGPHSPAIGWGNGNGMATRIQRPPGFAHAPNCRVPQSSQIGNKLRCRAHCFKNGLYCLAQLYVHSETEEKIERFP